MEKIIEAVPTEDIVKELTPERFVRKTNYGNNDIYVINAHNAPNTLREIGRLREWAFRESGGGTGKSGGAAAGSPARCRSAQIRIVSTLSPRIF